MRLESPDGAVAVDVTERSADGRPTIAVRYEGEPVLRPSPLGIETLSGSYARGLSIVDATERSIDASYETPGGKRREHAHRAVETSLTLEGADGRIELDVRVAADGVAYRYRLPGEGPVVVTGEESAFRVPEDAGAWLMPFEKKHEGVWRETTTAEAAGQYGFPALLEVGGGRWVSLTESNVDGRYAASRFAVDPDGSTFRLRFPDSPNHRMTDEEQEISGRRPLATPWRVAIVGDLSAVVESDLVADLLNESDEDPSRLDDESWIAPGRVAWSWWSDGSSPSDEAVQRRYVDYASERGWEYVLVDEGWDAAWLSDVVDYANERDVGVFAWSRWSDLDTAEKREIRLSRWKEWGVAGVKVDFMNSDAQEMMQFYDELAAATAERELMLNVHGSITPKGLRRRWPHLLTYEGVYGAENYHPAPKTIPPEHNAILPYTRNVLGPMDFTPVTFSAETRRTSVGHELAQSVVFESALQHFADDVEEYARRPHAERFLEAVPAVWDETRFVSGRPGSEATIARRRGEEWFLGSITAGDGRAVEAPLSFLDDGRKYAITVVHDDETGERLRLREDSLESVDSLAVAVPENGGFGARLRPVDG